jgi:hypothetical protein
MSGGFSNAYIKDLDGGGNGPVGNILYFQFIPTDASESKSARYTSHEILGRSSPILAYQGSDARQIGLTLKFFAQPFEGNETPNLSDIDNYVNWLRSFVYPDYSQGIRPPHRVLLRLGNSIAMVAVVTEYTFNPTPGDGGVWQFEGSEVGPTYTHYVEIKLTFQEVKAIPFDVNDIRSGSASLDTQAN